MCVSMQSVPKGDFPIVPLDPGGEEEGGICTSVQGKGMCPLLWQKKKKKKETD